MGLQSMTTLPRRSVVPTNPTTEPLQLSEAKKHLEIAPSDDTHDEHLRALIVAAREVWEHDTQSLTVARSVVEKIDAWPDESWRFYYRPVSAVASVTYYDVANASQTLASSVYSLDATNRQLRLDVDQEWPDIEDRWDAITVTYTAGETLTSEIAKHAMKLQISMLFGDDLNKREYDNWAKAYENLVGRYQRSSYP